MEDHNTVYRGAAPAGGTSPPPSRAAPPSRAEPPAEAVWQREIRPDPVLLFRYSALTMNSHRIHYDRDYVTGVEGYPGLLVHGNLTTTLLLDLFRRERPEASLKTFAVRALAPLFDTAPFTLAGAPGPEDGTARLWAITPTGTIAQSRRGNVRGLAPCPPAMRKRGTVSIFYKFIHGLRSKNGHCP